MDIEETRGIELQVREERFELFVICSSGSSGPLARTALHYRPMRRLLLATILSVISGSDLDGQPATALATAREVERLARSRSFWPGFDPLDIPLAIYDGKSTWLFRHPSPPRDFEPSSISSIMSNVREGRHPAVTSNSSAEIGGVLTATLIADGARANIPPRDLAAIAIHEAFHVFQRTKHPHWQANEGDLLLYPVDDANLLALRRFETEALRRALDARERSRVACFARLAVDYRMRRFAAMDSAFATYERATELNEGLATYVQLLASGKPVQIPVGGFAPGDVRHRSYAIGPAIAFLLDRIRPGWQHSLEAHDRQRLDEVLSGALAGETPSPNGGCAIPPPDSAIIVNTAKRDAAAVAQERVARQRAFDTRAGWRVILIAAEKEPLFPQGFDPLNVERVDGGLLHTRFITLGNDRCKATAIDEAGVDLEVMTVGIGPHPLFNGVRRAVIAGLGRPEITHAADRVAIHTPGLTVECAGATVEERGQAVTVSLASSPGPTLP